MAETTYNTAERLTAFIAQNYTDIETGPGSVISELLIKLAAAIQNEQYNTIQTLNQGSTIKQITDSAETTYSPLMDLIASNYNTERSSGVKVRGKLKVTVSAADDYLFRKGYQFVQPLLNLTYTIPANIRFSMNPSRVTTEKQMYADTAGYYFLLDVEASAEGPEYQVASGTRFTLPPKFFITNLVSIEAYGNFSSGAAKENDKQLVAKIKNNLGNSRFESEAGIFKQFSSTFSGFKTLSICGANDPELTRAKQNALGISTFGKADVYVRSSLGPETVTITKTGKRVADGLWELDIANDDAPGFYYVKSIIPLTTEADLTGTLVVVDTHYGTGYYPFQRHNELNNDDEARFTKYQTARLRFKYTNNSLDKMDFVLQLVVQPNILEMQDMLLLDSQRLACADYLVKAVVPCFVSLEINLIKKRTSDTYTSLNLQKLKKDIFSYVNSIPFGEELQASSIIDICHNYDIKRVDLPIKMSGNVFCSDGTIIPLADSAVLTIPENLAKGVTKKTTLYFIDYYRFEAGVVQPIDNIALSIA